MRYDLLLAGGGSGLDAAKRRHAAAQRHSLPATLSRRQFLAAAAGAGAAGAVLGAGLLRPGETSAAPGIGLVEPIPGTLNLFGEDFHVLAPPLTAPDDDPSSVFNFRGATGIAFISGMCTRTNRRTGEEAELPFAFNDMRFMKGVFRGRDGHVRDGTFAFVWIDVYDPSLGGIQVSDFNPGITQTGVFWTDVVAASSVAVDLGAGTATLEVHDHHMKDYFDIENALIGGGPPPQPGSVSYKVVWTAVGASTVFDNPAQSYRGTMRMATAQMEWSARTTQYDFVSAPLASSTTDAAQLGGEVNGSFYVP